MHAHLTVQSFPVLLAVGLEVGFECHSRRKIFPLVLVKELPVMPVHSKPNPLMEVGYRVSTSSTTTVTSRYEAYHWDDLVEHLLCHKPASAHHLTVLGAGRFPILGNKTCVLYILTVQSSVQLFMRRNSVYVAFILGGALIGERVSTSVFRSLCASILASLLTHCKTCSQAALMLPLIDSEPHHPRCRRAGLKCWL